jgi:hypothetical protein
MRVFRVGGILGLALAVALAAPGCKKKPKAKAKEDDSAPAENPLKPKPGGPPAKSLVGRGVQRQVNQQLLRNIGQYYQLYRTENGRAPRSLEEFLGYVKSDPNARTANIPQALESGWVVMVFTPEPGGNQVLAYEKEAFQTFGNRLVLLGDGNSVQLMYEADFKAALGAR